MEDHVVYSKILNNLGNLETATIPGILSDVRGAPNKLLDNAFVR